MRYDGCRGEAASGGTSLHSRLARNRLEAAREGRRGRRVRPPESAELGHAVAQQTQEVFLPPAPLGRLKAMLVAAVEVGVAPGVLLPVGNGAIEVAPLACA